MPTPMLLSLACLQLPGKIGHHLGSGKSWITGKGYSTSIPPPLPKPPILFTCKLWPGAVKVFCSPLLLP